MKTVFRTLCVLLAILVVQLSLASAVAAAETPVPPAAKGKVTVNDPQIIPLSEQKSASTGVRWYWYLVGALVIGGVAAMGGGGGGGSSSPTTGTVSGSW